MNMELKEVKESLVEQKRSHESIICAFENTMNNESSQIDE